MAEIEFRDTQYMTANDKRLVLKAWIRFLNNGLRWQNFTNRLYNHLIQHCSFIAHYDKAGFYNYYFRQGNKTVQFLGQFDARNTAPGLDVPGCVEIGGMTYWSDGDYADINRAMVAAATPYIARLLAAAEATQRDADLAEAARLLAKHGIAIAKTEPRTRNGG